MKGEIYRVKGDVVEVVYDPKFGEPKVGGNLILEDEKGGLLVQVIELRFPSYFPSPEEREVLKKELKIAVGKVRKEYNKDGLEPWEGWIPGREVKIREAEATLLPRPENPIRLGKAVNGEDFLIEARHLEKVNIITGVKGSGKSHLAKVIMLGLSQLGAPCIVFDINREYMRLKKEFIHLEAGRGFKLGIREMGIGPLSTMLESFGLPWASLIYFENRLSQLLREASALEKRGMSIPFIGINQLIQLAEKGEYCESDGEGVVNRTIRSRLEAVKNTGILASSPQEVCSFHKEYSRIRHGGALIVDISHLSTPARRGLVQSLIDALIKIAEEEAEGEERFPFVFFEEAHLYVPQGTIDRLITRARHLGITSFFITNTISSLDESVLRQADNLFIFHLPLEEDVRHVSKSALTDYETISSLNLKLKPKSCLLIGEASGRYPSVVEVDPLPGVETKGETRYFFKRNSDSVQLKLWM